MIDLKILGFFKIMIKIIIILIILIDPIIDLDDIGHIIDTIIIEDHIITIMIM